jgi:hypothetical protein
VRRTRARAADLAAKCEAKRGRQARVCQQESLVMTPRRLCAVAAWRSLTTASRLDPDPVLSPSPVDDPADRGPAPVVPSRHAAALHSAHSAMAPRGAEAPPFLQPRAERPRGPLERIGTRTRAASSSADSSSLGQRRAVGRGPRRALTTGVGHPLQALRRLGSGSAPASEIADVVGPVIHRAGISDLATNATGKAVSTLFHGRHNESLSCQDRPSIGGLDGPRTQDRLTS